MRPHEQPALFDISIGNKINYIYSRLNYFGDSNVNAKNFGEMIKSYVGNSMFYKKINLGTRNGREFGYPRISSSNITIIIVVIDRQTMVD